MLPVNSAIDVTRLLIGIAFAGADSGLRRKELDLQVSRLKIEAETRLQEMRINTQKEVYLSLIELSRHAFDRKMDFFVKAFSDFMSLLREQQLTLEADLKALRDERFTAGMTDEDLVKINKSRTDIRNELAELRLMSATMTCEFNMRVSYLSPELRLSVSAFGI
jgi:hypothetical protein